MSDWWFLSKPCAPPGVPTLKHFRQCFLRFWKFHYFFRRRRRRIPLFLIHYFLEKTLKFHYFFGFNPLFFKKIAEFHYFLYLIHYFRRFAANSIIFCDLIHYFSARRRRRRIPLLFSPLRGEFHQNNGFKP